MRKLILLALLAACSDSEQSSRDPRRVVSPYALRSAQDCAYRVGYERGYSLGWSIGYSSHPCFCVR